MEYKLSWFTENEKLFPFIKVDLVNDLINLGREDKINKLKFSKKYQLEYIGEVAERWHERNLVQDDNDLISLVLGLSLSERHQFLYDQKNMFVKMVFRKLEKNWNLTAALTLLFFAREQRVIWEDVEGVEISDLIDKIVSDTWITNQNEMIYRVSFATMGLSEIPEEKQEHWKEKIFEGLDNLSLSLTDAHCDYPLLLLLSELYTELDKPKAKMFKTKGMVRFLQAINGLREKEVAHSQVEGIVNALSLKGEKISPGKEKKEIFTYNYIMAVEYPNSTKYDSNITEPGYGRIKNNYLESNFISDEEINEGFEKRIGAFGEDRFHFMLDNLDAFQNVTNLKRLLTLIDHEYFMLSTNVSYIRLLKNEEPLISEDQQNSLIKILLTETKGLSKEQFAYLEEQKELRGITIKPTSNYVFTAIKYGYIFVEDIEKVEEQGFLQHVIEYVKKQKSTEEYIAYLERAPVSYYRPFIKEFSYSQKLKMVTQEELQRRSYELYLKGVFYHEPETYPQTVYELLKEESFVTLFGYSNDEIEAIEHSFYDQKLVNENSLEELRVKFTPDEELERERIEKVAIDLRESRLDGYGYYTRSRIDGLSSLIHKHMEDIEGNEMLKEIAFTRLIDQQMYATEDIQKYLLLVYKLKAKNFFTIEQEKEIEMKLIQLAEKCA